MRRVSPRRIATKFSSATLCKSSTMISAGELFRPSIINSLPLLPVGLELRKHNRSNHCFQSWQAIPNMPQETLWNLPNLDSGDREDSSDE